VSIDLLQYAGFLLRAAGTTLWISWLALLLAGVLGAVVALLRLSRWRALRIVALLYVEIFRSIPILLVMFFCFFGTPVVFGLDLSAFAAATAALALFNSAGMSEAIRAGLLSVGKGQREAAQALGLHRLAILVRIVVPQAIPVILPPAVSIYIGTLKESALASIIGYVELTKTGLLIVDATGGGLSPMLVVAVVYFLMNLAISSTGRLLELRLAHWQGS
jgi:His/Glu/Gln/Arg/opine family amino acid ABC transporter permease subunit